MYVVRAACENDLESVFYLASCANLGITSLSKDRDLLEKKIRLSEDAFKEDGNFSEKDVYLFVLENTQTQSIIGLSSLVSQVGMTHPLCTYIVKKEFCCSKDADVSIKHEMLVPTLINHGPTEVATLYLLPEERKLGMGRLLSLSRFLFIAAFRKRFKGEVMAEMRGYIDEKGCCPFWESFGKHFYRMDFAYANLLRSESVRFMTDLQPKHPIYTFLLPIEVKEVIGKTHPNTHSAVRLLNQEGFNYHQQIDVFDGGPHLMAKVDQIRSISKSKKLRILKLTEPDYDIRQWIISNDRLRFKACYGSIVEKDGSVCLPSNVAESLDVSPGDWVRFVKSKE